MSMLYSKSREDTQGDLVHATKSLLMNSALAVSDIPASTLSMREITFTVVLSPRILPQTMLHLTHREKKKSECQSSGAREDTLDQE